MWYFKVLIFIGCLLFGYFFGSLPMGVIVTKLIFHKDPRNEGSHNTGATNVLRTAGRRASALVLLLDILKMIVPFIAVWAIFTFVTPVVEFMSNGDLTPNVFGYGNTLCELAYYLTALGCFIGHPYSCFLKFNGGKLVSCYLGFNIPISYYGIPFFAPFFIITFKKTKLVSLSSLVVCGAIFLWSWVLYILYATLGDAGIYYITFFGLGPHVCIYFPVVNTIAYCILIYRHKENIKRLFKGEEKQVHLVHTDLNHQDSPSKVNEKHD